MKNLIKFETVDRPIVSGTSSFPYDDVIKSLKVLDKTKAIIIDIKEINGGNMTMLRRIATRLDIGYVKRAKVKDKIYLWLANRKEEAE